MDDISQPPTRERAAAPLLKKTGAGGRRRPLPRWRVWAPAAIVLVVATAVSLLIYFLISKSEKNTAAGRFTVEADDLAAKLSADAVDKMRDSRDIASRTASLVATYGAIPHRKVFQQLAEATRINPNAAAFVGISLVSTGCHQPDAFLTTSACLLVLANSFVVSFLPFFSFLLQALNVSQSQRPQFEQGMSAENNKTIVVFTPAKGANSSAPIRPYHTTNLVATVGTEAARGFNTGVLSWSWSEFSPSSEDLTRRLPRSGRTLASVPSALSTSLARFSVFFLIQAPVLVDPVAFSRWNPLALTADTIDAMYCWNPADIGTGACNPSFGRQPPDARAAFITTMTAVDVPVYALLNNNSKDPNVQSDILPLCKPAAKFDLQDPYVLSNTTTSFKMANGSCLPVANQYLRAQAPFIVGKKRMLSLGLVSCSFYAEQLIRTIVSMLRRTVSLLSAECSSLWLILLFRTVFAGRPI
jgi:hypothetical protein